MLERLVAWFCNNYLGRYFENLNTDQLSVALLQGEVELENVPLKKDVLDKLGLPIQIHAGFVGKICFQIPLTKIRSEPWVISFEQLYLVAGPKDKNEPFNEEAEESATQEHKLMALDLMEAEWRSEYDPQVLTSSPLYSLTYSSWISYGASLVTNIVQNIQVKVKDIHLRYEDGISCPGSVFAFGVRVESLIAQTCDENWLPKFMASAIQGTMYKLFELDRLAIYWDTRTDLFSQLSTSELSHRMKQPCSSDIHDFLLAPVTGHAHYKRNCSQKPLRSLNLPRIACDFQLDRVNVELRDVQYHQIVQCCRSLELLSRGLQFRRWRLDSDVADPPIQRWKFAYQCVLSDIRKKNRGRNWSFLNQRVRDILTYVRSYKEYLIHPAAMPVEAKLERERIELEFELEELQILRSIAMEQIPTAGVTSGGPSSSGDPQADATSQSTSWFSSWWTVDNSANHPSATEEQRMENEIIETLEDAVRDNTVSQRDFLPLQLTCTLKQGLVRISTRQESGAGQSWKAILELECDNVIQEWESRPRLKSHKFHLSLGNVWVRDCWTDGTLYPLIVSPQRKDFRLPARSSSTMANSLITGLSLPPFFRRNCIGSPMEDEVPLFDLVYEQRPPGSNWNHRLKVKSLSVECVYNQQLLQKILDIFTIHHTPDEDRSMFGKRLRQAARSGFEAVKQKTKEEISLKWIAASKQRHSWDLLVDISAPHILIPESVTARESLLLVVDFGHFYITRSELDCISGSRSPDPGSVPHQQETQDSLDDDEYQTPCSTPPNEPESPTGPSEINPESTKDPADVSDKYNVHFSDLQLLVCRVKDNWKHAYLKGTSALHLLDRFSILIHVEKSENVATEPERPFLSLNASLPSLVVHINEQKVQALVSIAKKLKALRAADSERPEEFSEDAEEEMAEVDTPPQRQILMQFQIEQLSVEVQSRGRSVAELQVGGVQASYSGRPADSSVCLAVHSLLLVDAMQTLGSDYELLIASHKHLYMDSMSGSLMESEPTSPVSPSSPDPSGQQKISRATSPLTLTQALTSLQTDPSWRKDGYKAEAVKPGALILIEVRTVNHPTTRPDGSKAEGRDQLINVHFNSLDVIANQDTVVELAGFFQRVIPKKTSDERRSNETASFPASLCVPEGTTNITFEFHRLTILLLRSSVKDDMLVGRKVATLSITDARIQANLASQVVVQGSLGGLQVLDLTAEGQKHQRVISVGHDPLVEQNQNLYVLVSQGLYESSKEKNEMKAFSFHFIQPEATNLSEIANPKLSLEIRMASLCYTHSVHFLAEVSACVSEFQQSVSNLAMSLRLTAAEMAVDLMHRGTEGLAQSIYLGNHYASSFHEGFHMAPGVREGDVHDVHDVHDELSLPSRVRFSALLESPILVLPRSVKSPQVLVAHLGQIKISNDVPANPSYPTNADDSIESMADELAGGTHQEHFEILIRDMSLYSLNVDEKWKTSFSHFYSSPPGTSGTSGASGSSLFLRVTAQELYSCASHGKPILHDTMLKFSLHRITGRPVAGSDCDLFVFPPNDLHPDYSKLELCDIFQVTGHVVSPLQVSLSRVQYQQIIDSLDNLNWNKVEASVSSPESNPEFPTTRSRPKRVGERELLLKLKFQLPRFSMELLDHSLRAIVSLSFEDFQVWYSQDSAYSATVQTSLKSLVLEDLNVKEDSKYRRLVASNSRESAQFAGRPRLNSFMSTSCPDLRNQNLFSSSSQSLPARLDPVRLPWKPSRKTVVINGADEYPGTPPSSPVIHRMGNAQSSTTSENLVVIKVLLIDPESSDFSIKYNSTQRFVEANFNSLDVVVNLESWVMVLDFFGTSPDKSSSPTSSKVRKKIPQVSSPGYQDWKANNRVVNSRWEVEVRSFNVLLNQKEYEVAEATISSLTWEMSSLRGNLDVTGKLGSITIQDLTTAGKKYRERFVTSGNEALDFQYFSFSADDAHLARDYDIRLNLNMASVLYVHTQRFYTECSSFYHRFQQLRKVSSSSHVADSKVPWRHGTRILLNVEAGSPVILLPVCSESDHLLVADLGKISISNRFVMTNGSVTTTRVPDRKSAFRSVAADSGSVLVDVIQVVLSNMDVRIGLRDKTNRSQIGDLILGSYLIRRNGGPSLLTETCEMKLEIQRNLDAHLSRIIPDIDVRGLLSTVRCSVDEEQYKLIRGLLAFNLGENLDYLQLDQTDLPVDRIHPQESKPVWSTLKLRIDLVNVILDVKNSEVGQFTTIEFIDSRLVYESNSDGSKDVDLVSQQVVLKDTRFDRMSGPLRRNVFTQILEPVTQSRREGTLQAEVHYRSTIDFTRFTVVLNNMRLLAIFDWWTMFHQFLILSPDEYKAKKNEDFTNTPRFRLGSTSSKWTSTSVRPSPIVVSTGVISKRSATFETNQIPFEFKINISDSEVVIVENPSCLNSFAVILKGTAILAYRPQMQSKPFSCQLNRVELFSSILSLEEETALSIVDPATISIEIVGKTSGSDTQGILEATSVQQVLEIQAQHLVFRLSYNDMKLFVRILDSLPRQKTEEVKEVDQLKMLGFSPDDCQEALEWNDNNVEEAALWLTQNAHPTDQGTNELKIRCVEVRTGCVSLCVIDDCRDADVPLLELTASSLLLRQMIEPFRKTGEGNITCQFAVEYYNRTLSGWEPFIEPFKCHLHWDFLPFIACDSEPKRHCVFFDTEDIVNVNFTQASLQLFRMVKDNWMEDYYSQTEKAEDQPDDSGMTAFRHRSPFVPFALHNATGSSLKFQTKTVSLLSDSVPASGPAKVSSTRWNQCQPGDVMAFSFENRTKLRHYDSHELQTRQLIIEIDGWSELDPVSIDRVGVYFRFASSPNSPCRQILNDGTGEQELNRVLVIIAVTLEGSARRLVTIRSALQVTNDLEETIELNLVPPPFNLLANKLVRVPPCTTYAIPMTHLMSEIFVRPHAEKLPHTYTFCNEPIEWQSIQQAADSTRLCNSITNNKNLPYRFAVNVRRENFPHDKQNGSSSEYLTQPAHTITLLKPLVIVNLLPYELTWEMKMIDSCGIIKPGKETSVHTVDVSAGFQISFRMENFVNSGDLIVGMPPHDFYTRIRLYDSANRLLLLKAKISSLSGGSVRLSVAASYWIVNKAGIPLIFRQESVQQEAAGQFDEHEMARSLTPMLFSFTDREASPTLTARIGSGLHPGCKPQWCQHFALQKGVRVRSFLVTPRDGRPELVYLVGISIRPGRGRYRDTQIVTLAPCYQLYNQSSYRLEVAQSCFATTFTDPGAQSTYLNLVSGCHLPFHWPRLDKDQLLCIRLLDVKNCHWSGGFGIRNISSFHINVRDSEGLSHFLRVEIVQQECTFRVVFSNADGFPPPFRIDNLSQVPIVFHQSDVPEARLHTTVRPQSSMPYVWDEPTKAPRLTVIAPGGLSSIYDMAILKEGNQLTYENFIYLCLGATFPSEDSKMPIDTFDCQNQELVLDVPEGTRVVLSRKETGKRSQLWRMTGSGMLQHEGSSPPRDPANPNAGNSRILVLDIAGPGLQPSEYVHLMLRKPDPRRSLTQTWHFTADGRLCCGHNNVFVQAKDGFCGVRQGNDVVLGPSQPVTYLWMPSGIPAEQAIHRQRLRPGSGFLCVKTITDGPTRVLQVTDLNKPAVSKEDVTDLVLKEDKAKELKLEMRFKGGMGISIVNHSPPEELAYCRLKDIILETVTGDGLFSLDASVQSVQIDNSLSDPLCPVILYVTPSVQQDESRHLPALRLKVHRSQASDRLNADVFKHGIVIFKNLTINIEENQLFKILAFAGFNQSDLELERLDESDFESQKSLNAATSIDAKRFYFCVLKLVLEQVRLSVFTSNKLSPELKAIKRKLGVKLVKFEDANIELDPFIRTHPFETAQLIMDSIVKHYKDELKSQAAKILGSTDFLGNPLGFVNDVSEGVSGFINEGNVGALVQNVTFGLSNSAAKVTGSLSDGLGRVTMDDRHEEVRQRLIKHTGSNANHLVTGLKGLGFGILGGMTSIFTQTYEGVSNEGISGLFTGIGKGLVGTVTKPAVGMLDLATGAASAVRDSSRTSAKLKEIPRRIRPPRLVIGPGGILPRYSERQGRGQELLFQMSQHIYQETFIAYEALGALADSLHMLISSEHIRVFSMSSPSKEVVLDIHLSELHFSKAVVMKDYGTQGCAQYYVELNLHWDTEESHGARRPQVRCDSESLAKKVSREINYAKSVYEENRHSLILHQGFQAENLKDN